MTVPLSSNPPASAAGAWPHRLLYRYGRPAGAALAGTALLSACALLRPDPPVADAGKPAATQSAAATSVPPTPAPAPATFEEAVRRAGEKVFGDAVKLSGAESRQIVIDPLIDANTAAQTASTVMMGDQLGTIVKTGFPTLRMQAFTRDVIAAKPLLVVGTVTPINAAGAKDGPPDVFRVWLTVIDLRSGRVMAKNINRATMETVDTRPLKFYADSPTWTRDRTVAGYINSCQVNTKVGDLADPIYLEHLPAAAVLNEAIISYNAGNLAEARDRYREAQALADPGDLRVSNGLYLTNWKLGEHKAAKDAFDHIVAFGLEAGRLPLKLLFRTGTTRFSQIGDWPEQYQVWLASVAQQTARFDACMKVVGHSSRTGDPAANQVLSLRRAETVQDLLERDNRDLKPRLSAAGMGSKELLVGLGTDDLRDALDRRVEFRVIDCEQSAGTATTIAQ